MKKRIVVCLVTTFVSIFGLVACGGEDEEQIIEPQQEQQQQATQPTTQNAPSTTQSNDRVAGLIGTWQATSIQGSSVSPGTQIITFTDDGSLQTTISNGSSNIDTTYSVLDDSRIEVIDQNGTPIVGNYTLEGDTLTLEYQGQTGTYQRTG